MRVSRHLEGSLPFSGWEKPGAAFGVRRPHRGAGIERPRNVTVVFFVGTPKQTFLVKDTLELEQFLEINESKNVHLPVAKVFFAGKQPAFVTHNP